ncbi:MAG: glutamate--tRNA ligase [Kineosporiaceae bacterium]
MLDDALIDSLFADDLPEVDDWERRYPPRDLPDAAHVTRFAPSPTGSVHIGGLYVAMVCQDLARRSGGRYLVRIEDTDRAREVPGALEGFRRAFAYAGLDPDEGVDTGGAYGPYRQSEREAIYHSFARHLLRRGRAYLCFATKDDLAALAARQESLKVPTGYYGEWALWRDADPARVRAALDEKRPYVVRFRSPNEAGRARYEDAIRGRLEHEANRNDVVLLKASDASPRLPTYHFAHAVDEHLMRVTTVVRGEEWLSSVPLHRQLFAALGIEPPRYAHVAPLMKLVPGGRRKLSKRHDPEAGVDFYLAAGYPAEAVLHYLRGLANGRLMDLPQAQALAAPLALDQFGTAGPLVDLPKLDDLSADHVAGMSGPEVAAAVSAWARTHDPEVADVLAAEPDLTLRALSVEREGVDNPRKDLWTWSGFRAAYGFFFPTLFTLLAGPEDERVTTAGLPGAAAGPFVRDLVASYRHLDDQGEWFDQIRQASARHGFAPSPKVYKKDPDAYVGSIRDAAQLVRVAVTGSTRSPDLHAISRALGEEEFLRRLRPLT